ncbi:MAG: hypothetical protein ACMXYD_01710 [Candidatus Woesearchaeota archaeon]
MKKPSLWKQAVAGAAMIGLTGGLETKVAQAQNKTSPDEPAWRTPDYWQQKADSLQTVYNDFSEEKQEELQETYKTTLSITQTAQETIKYINELEKAGMPSDMQEVFLELVDSYHALFESRDEVFGYLNQLHDLNKNLEGMNERIGRIRKLQKEMDEMPIPNYRNQ